ncbi:MAG: GDP-mannose 4,6-dehydratase [Thermoplasmata archaeon]
MKILITGASGFIGRYLSSLAVQRGHEVVGTYLTENDLKTRTPKNPAIKWLPLDIRQRAEVNSLIDKVRPEAVFHLAAQAYVKQALLDPADTFLTNVLGTIYLYEALKTRPPREGILLASSSSAYGLSKTIPATEDTPLRPMNPYGVSKACQDMLSGQYSMNFGLRIVRARLYITTGPGKVGDALNDFAKQVAVAEVSGGPGILKVGNLESRRDISDVRDIVEGLWTVFEKGTSEEPVNVGAGESYSIRDIVDKLKLLSMVPLSIVRDPGLVRPSDEPVIEGDIRRLRQLGYVRRVPFEMTIEDSLNYWREEMANPHPLA